MQPTRRRRRLAKRSLAGCRTCRARHIKCDEAPGICNNCTSTARKCDGYDITRLPVKKLAIALLPHANIGSALGWVTTTEERRFFSYFTHCSIPSLATFSNSPLWQNLALQMGHVDRAVYHAASMLGAIHEDSNQNQMRLSGENLHRPRHGFALEQASRAFEHLNYRQASQDPQYRRVLLLCCLLFILSDLLLGKYDSAFRHLRSGLLILRETQQQRLLTQHYELSLDSCLIRTFQRLDIESSHFGTGGPFLFTSNELEENWPEQSFYSPLKCLDDAYQSLTYLFNIGIPFLAKCWPLSGTEIKAEYGKLFYKQQRLLSSYYQLQRQAGIFHKRFFHQLSHKEQVGLEILQLQCLGQILGLKTCLIDGLVPADLLPEYETLLAACEELVSKFPARPTITLDYCCVASLYVVVSRCPQYSLRLQAINVLLSWPHSEGVINSNVVASLALETMKTELQTKDQRDMYMSLVDREADEELARFLFDTLRSAQDATNWSLIRAAKIFQVDGKKSPSHIPEFSKIE
ncbi:hypothetical protein BGW36DRAFT_415520 [Talaromyces proteolyticus]|uniref:Zn(2)-C6 fungal-type domain-containing protein n=1 Tax=Talaromyces proteolyticus TaxID=1131652 RepID=A0AAD4KZ31_9EURO|nr:uncharacterized protein BGW36DRAFT_415520 [Talaromyces proteolyticus]KAH8700470.1 hypothetical protein BGW36DRAFT_415520 [Talaromyces proteolyticus]